jgi:hypothetical protein
MAQQSFPFENIDVTESQFSQWATNFQETGIKGNPLGSDLSVSAEGSTLSIEVAAGQAFIRGHYYINTSTIELPVPSAGINTRIDIVALELDPEANTIVAKLIQGEPVVSSPVAPELIQTETGIYQLPLATLTIPNSTLAITEEMLVDVRTYVSTRVGAWTSETRPGDPVPYSTFGFNFTTLGHEFWTGDDWVSFANPITTEGDLIAGGPDGMPTRVPIGLDGEILKSDGTTLRWAPAPSEDGGTATVFLLMGA